MRSSEKVSFKNSKPFIVALVIVILGFATDTVSTLACGPEMRAYDLNPLIRHLSTKGYITWSIIRLALASVLLALGWPNRLLMREWVSRRGTWLALLVPFSYQATRTYFIAVLVMVIGPLKLMAGCSNLFLLSAGHSLLKTEVAMVVGILVGIFLANVILLWNYVLLGTIRRGGDTHGGGKKEAPCEPKKE